MTRAEKYANLYAVDIETGGLPLGSPIIEVAYKPVFSLDPPTVLWNLSVNSEDCNPSALEINHCFDPGRVHAAQERTMWADAMAYQIADDLAGTVLLAANPQFDSVHLAYFLEEWGGIEKTWSYRSVDIGSFVAGYAMEVATQEVDFPERGWGQDWAAKFLELERWSDEVPHTAWGDVLFLSRIARSVLA